MAINIWEQGGKPTNYTSLPTVNSLLIELNKDYTISFKAKSPSKAILRVSSYNNVNDLNENITLTNEFKYYTLSWYESQGGQLFFIDKDGSGDIEVQDIKVVEKGMGVSTINGISSNLSEWRQHSANINWAFMEDSSRITLMKRIPIEPASFTYYINLESGYEYYIRYYTNETSDAVSNEGWGLGGSGKKINPPNNAKFAGIILKRTDQTPITPEEVLKMKPVLSVGMSVPWEPKTGDRMIKPQSTEKNLFDKQDFAINKYQGTGSTYRYDMIVKPNTEYTLSTNAPFDVSGSANIYFNGTSTGIDGVQSGSPKTVISGGKGELYILVRYATNNAYQKVLDGEYIIQIEEGTIPTPFSVQRNKVSINTATSGKNMFIGFESGYLNSGTFNEKPLSGSNGQRTSLWMDCEPGVKYALSGGDRSSWHFKNANGAIFAGLVGSDFGGVITPPNGAVLMRVYYSSDGTHGFPQIEKDEVSSYEKPIMIPKKAIKIPKKNMVKEDTVILDATTIANVIHDETIKLDVGKTYTLSAIIPTGVTMQPRKEYTGAVYQNLNGNGSKMSLTFVATHEILVLRKYTVSPIGLVTVSEIQIEEGNQTPFEKYTPVNKPARKGIEMDGVFDYLESKTLPREPKYPFTIELDFIWYGKHFNGTVGLFGNTAFTVRFDGLGAPLNKVNLVKYNIADQRITIPFDILPNVRYRFKLITETDRVKLYIDDVFISEFMNSTRYIPELYNDPITGKFVVGVQGKDRAHNFKGIFERVKYYDDESVILEYDFNKPGEMFKTKVYGNPTQLNKQSRR